MDPITQGVVGATMSQTVSKRAHLGFAALTGALGGMAADMDVFIRSASDPLLGLEYHRHFTHSLFFIPFGGLLVALAIWLLFGKRKDMAFKPIWLWSTVGYATHGLLDGCTSYGTQLLWPLSNTRFSIDIVSVVDPLFTLPLLALMGMALWKKAHKWVWFAVAWGSAYLLLGAFQHHRAVDLGYKVAKERGHSPLRLEAKPSFANVVVWKVVYEADGRFYVVAVRPGWKQPKVWPGSSVAKLDVQRDFPWLNPSSQQAKDIERFTWFSSGFVALDTNDKNRVVDMRYSLLPNQIKPLWWIELDPTAAAHAHVKFESSHDGGGSRDVSTLWDMMVK